MLKATEVEHDKSEFEPRIVLMPHSQSPFYWVVTQHLSEEWGRVGSRHRKKPGASVHITLSLWPSTNLHSPVHFFIPLPIYPPTYSSTHSSTIQTSLHLSFHYSIYPFHPILSHPSTHQDFPPLVLLFIHPSILLSLLPSICPSFHSSICPSVQISSIHLSFLPTYNPSIHPTIRPPIHPSSHPPTHTSVHSSAHPPTHPHSHPHIHSSIQPTNVYLNDSCDAQALGLPCLEPEETRLIRFLFICCPKKVNCGLCKQPFDG